MFTIFNRSYLMTSCLAKCIGMNCTWTTHGTPINSSSNVFIFHQYLYFIIFRSPCNWKKQQISMSGLVQFNLIQCKSHIYSCFLFLIFLCCHFFHCFFFVLTAPRSRIVSLIYHETFVFMYTKYWWSHIAISAITLETN